MAGIYRTTAFLPLASDPRIRQGWRMTDVAAKSATGRLTLVQGTALYVGAVLGTGVIALPALAADVAGPASLLAWLGLAALSAPFAATFAALGARYPDSGGVATYSRLAFGDKAAAMVGWWFYFAVPPGAVAATMFGGAYVESAIGGGFGATAGAAAVMLVIVTLTNAFGVQVTGRVQIGLAGLLVLLLLASIVLSLPHAQAANLRPFAPHGWLAIGSAAALLVWSFVGWEAITHLTAEFRRPDRDVPRATTYAVILVGGLYLAVAAAIIAVLGSAAAQTAAPLGDLMAAGLGGNARYLAAIAATMLTLGVVNVYFAGSAKLGAALGRDGALPAWLTRGSQAGEVPRRSLAVVATLTFTILVVVMLGRLELKPLVLVTTGSFLAVYAVGIAAALRLLPKQGKAHWAAIGALGAVILLLIVSGLYLLWPVVVGAAAFAYLRLRRPAANHPMDSAVDDASAGAPMAR
jgi:amino acid efflux transporter